MLGFVKKYIKEKNEKLLKKNIELQIKYPEDYKGEKIIETNSGEKICLINFIVDTIGRIKIVSTKGKLGMLTYTFYNNEDGKRCIHIGDIVHKPINRGIGSHLIKYLEEIAKTQKITIITGWLSPVDFKHKERLLHFYKKNGFVTRLREDVKGGYNISKSL